MSAQDPPDLAAVEESIQEARDAQDELQRVAPEAINPEEEQRDEQREAAPDAPTRPDTRESDLPQGPRAESDEPG